MGIVKADIDRATAFGRNDIGGRVSGIHSDHRQRGGVKMVSPIIKVVRRQFVHQAHHRGQRIVGTMRIGSMALLADNAEMCVQRSTAADLDHLAHFVGTCGFANQTDIHPLARFFHIIQQRQRPVDAFGLFIAGDGQHNRPVWRGVTHEINRSRGKGSDT